MPRYAMKKAILAIVEPVITPGEMQAGEHLAGVGEIEATRIERRVPLLLVEGDLHVLCIYNKAGHQVFVDT